MRHTAFPFPSLCKRNIRSENLTCIITFKHNNKSLMGTKRCVCVGGAEVYWWT